MNETEELQQLMIKTGHNSGPVNSEFDDTTRNSMTALVSMENLEERWDGKGDLIDRCVVEYLRDRFKNLS